MITLKMAFLGILFLLSGGSLFGRIFQGKLWLELLAGIVATVSFSYLAMDVISQMVAEKIDEKIVITQPPVNPEPPKLPVSSSVSSTPPVSPPPPPPVVEPPKPVSPPPSNLPLTSNGEVDFQAIFHPTQDAFETSAEFEARRKELVARFNQAAQQHDVRVQAGTVHLDKANYNIETGMFPVSIQLSPWVTSFRIRNKGTIQAVREEAKRLYEEGPEKPFFITVVVNKIVNNGFLVGLGKEIMVVRVLVPSQKVRSWRAHSSKNGYTAICTNCLTFTSDGQLLASGGLSDRTLKLWQVSTGQLLNTLTEHEDDVWSVAISPDGQWLASGSWDKTVKLWQVSTGQLLKTLTGHEGEMNSVAISPDGQWLASGSGDKTVKLWQVRTGQLLKTLTGHENNVMSVAISPDGQWLASGSSDNSIKLWQVSTGQLLNTLTGHENDVNSVAISPDGQWLASGSEDKTIKLWQVSTGQLLKTLTGHEEWVYSVAISPDGQWLASGSGDKTIKLWQVSTGQLLKTLTGHEDPVYSVAFSPDGWLASGDVKGVIKLWE